MSTQIHRMEPRWIGPYLVVESLNKGRVKLKNISTDKILRNTYNISNLKVYSNKQGSSPNQCPDDSVKGTVNGVGGHYFLAHSMHISTRASHDA